LRLQTRSFASPFFNEFAFYNSSDTYQVDMGMSRKNKNRL